MSEKPINAADDFETIHANWRRIAKEEGRPCPHVFVDGACKFCNEVKPKSEPHR